MNFEIEVTQEIKLRAKSLKLSVKGYLQLLIENDLRGRAEKIYKGEFNHKDWNEFTNWAERMPFDYLLNLQPLTIEQYYELRKKYSINDICGTLLKMESYKPVIKWKSIYNVLNNWLRR